jgi:hypothetical protein
VYFELKLYGHAHSTRYNITVIKSGLARRVDPGPGRPGGWTGPGLIKDRLCKQHGQTRATQANPNETQFFFFSNVGFEIH